MMAFMFMIGLGVDVGSQAIFWWAFQHENSANRRAAFLYLLMRKSVPWRLFWLWRIGQFF